MLSTEEIALNYLMLTIGSMVALIDFGFAPQFGRNFTYVFSGAKTLQKEGLNREVGDKIDYHLLRCLIDVAKMVYRRMSIIVLFLMAIPGTYYVYRVTDGFERVHGCLWIWIVYSLSTYFNIYFFYYSSLLAGRGLIQESKKSMMASKITYILLTYAFLFCGIGLMGVCLANLISPFVNRWLSYRYFYDKDILCKLSCTKSTKAERSELFSIIWFNAKKLGVNFIGAYAILKFSMFIAGLYLTMAEISSYGLMIQLATLLTGIGSTFLTASIPRITSLRVSHEQNAMIRNFAMAMIVFYMFFIIGSFGLIILGPTILGLIGSNAQLPETSILLIYLIVTLLENNHGQFATFITTGNDVPFVKAAIFSGIIICLGDFVILKYTDLDLLGLVLVQGIVQLAYNNWYWPYYVLCSLNITYFHFLIIGVEETCYKANKCIKKYYGGY